jgi:hypothetical protein
MHRVLGPSSNMSGKREKGEMATGASPVDPAYKKTGMVLQTRRMRGDNLPKVQFHRPRNQGS